MVGDGVVAGAEEAEQPLPLLEGVVVLPHQEAGEAELQFRKDLVRPAKVERLIHCDSVLGDISCCIVHEVTIFLA